MAMQLNFVSLYVHAMAMHVQKEMELWSCCCQRPLDVFDPTPRYGGFMAFLFYFLLKSSVSVHKGVPPALLVSNVLSSFPLLCFSFALIKVGIFYKFLSYLSLEPLTNWCSSLHPIPPPIAWPLAGWASYLFPNPLVKFAYHLHISENPVSLILQLRTLTFSALHQFYWKPLGCTDGTKNGLAFKAP